MKKMEHNDYFNTDVLDKEKFIEYQRYVSMIHFAVINGDVERLISFCEYLGNYFDIVICDRELGYILKTSPFQKHMAETIIDMFERCNKRKYHIFMAVGFDGYQIFRNAMETRDPIVYKWIADNFINDRQIELLLTANGYTGL